MLEAHQITHSYGWRGREALRGASFEASDGILGVLGRNGAGKTTLLRVLATLLRPSGGELLFDGGDALADPDALRRATAYLPQDMGYPRHVSAQTYVRYLLSLRGADTSGADRWLGELGLGPVAGKKLGTYSGGMRQRAGLAYALACEARILLLDEPTQGLDPWERVRLHTKLAEIASDRLILFSTHIVSDIESVATRVLILDRGAVRYDGTPAGLVADRSGEPVWVIRGTQALRATGCTVTAVRRLGDGMIETRGVGEPPAGAELVEATVEDRYLRMTDHGRQPEIPEGLMGV